jgi:thymidine phosphorylase
MSAIIRDQGPAEKTSLGAKVLEVTALKSGQVETLDCWRLARIARAAGAPLFKGAGVDLLKKTGANVKKGEPLYRIHAEIKSDFAFARAMAEENSGYKIR